MSKRHNFAVAVIQTLRQRVANRCSNPECRVVTTGPVADQMKLNVIGEAAHITAAAPGGPRYDETLTRAERSNIQNAIWLCSNCSDRIDKDTSYYTVELLQRWKARAEAIARMELGKSLPSQQDIELFKGVALGSIPKTRIADALSKVASIAKNDLERLDPRFVVSTSYIDGITLYSLAPLEPVEIKAKLDVARDTGIESQLVSLIEHGDSLVIEADRVNFEGSAIFELHNGEPATIAFSPVPIGHAVQKITLYDPNANDFLQIDDFHGEITAGTKSFTYRGKTFGELLSLEYRLPHSLGGSQKAADFKFGIDFSLWQGQSVQRLPYLEKAFNFFRSIVSGWRMQIALEVNGGEVFKGQSSVDKDDDGMLQTYKILEYIRNVQGLAKFLKINITFSGNVTVSAEDASWLNILNNLLFMRGSDSSPKIESFSLTIIPVNKIQLRDLTTALRSGKSNVMRIDQKFCRPVNLLGTEMLLPALTFIQSETTIRARDPEARPKLNEPIEVEVVTGEHQLQAFETEKLKLSSDT